MPDRPAGRRAAIGCLLAVSALLCATVGAAPASAQSGDAAPRPGPLQAQVFTHPGKKFKAVVPPGAEIVRRGANFDLSVQSRRGYLIHVQTGAVDPALSLPQMMAKFEARYVGDDKPLKRALNARTATVAGLAAQEAVFEGSGTRARLVVARGAKTDFVFMFFAPVTSFEALEVEFGWFLEQFEPAAEERAAAAAVMEPKPQEKPRARPAKTSSPPELPQSFSDREAGYAIAYPADWIAERASADVSAFSGREGTAAARATVTIQNVQPPQAKSPHHALAQVMEAIRSQLTAGATNIRYLGEGIFTYSKAGLTLEGHQVLLSYNRDGERVRQWTVVLPRPRETTVHVWSYASPEDSYETYRPTADAMLKAWTIGPKG
jgi:hypothetical protein